MTSFRRSILTMCHSAKFWECLCRSRSHGKCNNRGVQPMSCVCTGSIWILRLAMTTLKVRFQAISCQTASLEICTDWGSPARRWDTDIVWMCLAHPRTSFSVTSAALCVVLIVFPHLWLPVSLLFLSTHVSLLPIFLSFCLLLLSYWQSLTVCPANTSFPPLPRYGFSRFLSPKPSWRPSFKWKTSTSGPRSHRRSCTLQAHYEAALVAEFGEEEWYIIV